MLGELRGPKFYYKFEVDLVGNEDELLRDGSDNRADRYCGINVLRGRGVVGRGGVEISGHGGSEGRGRRRSGARREVIRV